MKPKQQGTVSSKSHRKSGEQAHYLFYEMAYDVSETARKIQVLNNHRIEREKKLDEALIKAIGDAEDQTCRSKTTIDSSTAIDKLLENVSKFQRLIEE